MITTWLAPTGSLQMSIANIHLKTTCPSAFAYKIASLSSQLISILMKHSWMAQQGG